MSIKGLHHVSITVKDFDATVELYTKGFGFKKGTAWGRSGERRAIMLEMGNGAFLEVFSGAPDEPQPSGLFAHIALASDDCDADYQRALAAGATVQTEPMNVSLPSDPPIPIRIAFVRGLDGESIEFFQYV
ncbi:MAG: VOC family protein [Anaerolineae bacterium]|nr:VOC family protein [Anaerolineae bacterium]